MSLLKGGGTGFFLGGTGFSAKTQSCGTGSSQYQALFLGVHLNWPLSSNMGDAPPVGESEGVPKSESWF